ncbi:hypothetical protein N8Z32_02065 [Ascidiaceihabitans sp.]|nr:hypothetical protein [Ascidiaceihabitans sp.]
MIGNFNLWFCTGVLSLGLTSLASSAMASCEQMYQDSDAGIGIHVRLSDKNEVEAIFTIGEGTFLAPKRSLIGKARTAATLDAKQAFSSWLNEAVAGGSVASSLMEQLEVTDQTGQTTGTVEELTQIGETMSSATASVLSGLVKLDECVDTEENYVLVELGWKPALSQAAREVRSDLSGTTISANNEKTAPKKIKTTTPIVQSDGYRKKSKLKDDF